MRYNGPVKAQTRMQLRICANLTEPKLICKKEWEVEHILRDVEKIVEKYPK